MRLKLGASKPVMSESAKAAKETAKEVSKTDVSLRRSNAAKKGVAEAFPSKAQLKKSLAVKAPTGKTPAKKTAAKTSAKPAVKVASKVVVVKAPAKTVAKVAAKKAAIKKPAARKA